MDMTEHRNAKVAELRTEAQTHRDRGAALDALAATIRATDVPIQRWRVHWHHIANECKNQARRARAHADELDTRADTVATAATARARYDLTP